MKINRLNEIDLTESIAQFIIGAWVCIENSGEIVFDYSKNSVDGILDGNASFDSDIYGSVLKFSGDSSVVIDSSKFVFPQETFSLLTRIKFNNTGNIETIWSAYDGAIDIHSHLYKDDFETIHISLGDGASVIDKTFSTIININEWIDIGIAWDSESNIIKGYINGIEDFSDTIDLTLKNSLVENILIGKKPGLVDNQFNGNITFFYVWNRCVNNTEFKILNTDPYFIFQNDQLINILLSDEQEEILLYHTVGRGIGEGIMIGIG
jgi:hypothetical protein